jgi:transcriptional regulator GlxA family with amidase domain
MKTIAVIAMHGVLPFDLATPCEVFGRVRTRDGNEAYRVRVCGEAREVKAGAFDLRVQWDLEHIAGADTVIVPGIANATMPISDDVVGALQRAVADGSRIASICTGAFVLAAAGLLDGARATTHWLAAAELAARYPAILVDPAVLYVDNGQILTSAGAAAGLDLCLHMVRRDYGAAIAANAARLAVMPLERTGGQSQFIVHEPPASTGSLRPLLQWMEENLDRPLDLAEISKQAAMSPRTLSRKFREQAGVTPLQWVLGARVRRAQLLLETTALSMEQVAGESGFGSAAALRERFQRSVGANPAAYRRVFGAADRASRAASQQDVGPTNPHKRPDAPWPPRDITD